MSNQILSLEFSELTLGLYRLWLEDLRLKQPELAEQVHVFNSFFYKKLNVKQYEIFDFSSYHDDSADGDHGI